ncbi:hypothetical protein JCM10908_001376 [Rhodotorula pacifica]|uniref:uncharacterized protein n=1 Tax=Rhodotorula pacifica TaxID=1495444 RepID=UPI0031801A4F
MDSASPPAPANARLAAIATLTRAASQRGQPAPSTTLIRPRSRSVPRPFHPQDDDDRPILERTTTQLARQLSLAKLTGQPAPPAPKGLLEPLPTLEELQQRAVARLQREERPGGGLRRGRTVVGSGADGWNSAATQAQGATDQLREAGGARGGGAVQVLDHPLPPPFLRRNNTVSGPFSYTTTSSTDAASSSSPSSSTSSAVPSTTPPLPSLAEGATAADENKNERQAIRANLIRKLSARRLQPKPPSPSSSSAGVAPILLLGSIPGLELGRPTPIAVVDGAKLNQTDPDPTAPASTSSSSLACAADPASTLAISMAPVPSPSDSGSQQRQQFDAPVPLSLSNPPPLPTFGNSAVGVERPSDAYHLRHHRQQQQQYDHSRASFSSESDDALHDEEEEEERRRMARYGLATDDAQLLQRQRVRGSSASSSVLNAAAAAGGGGGRLLGSFSAPSPPSPSTRRRTSRMGSVGLGLGVGFDAGGRKASIVSQISSSSSTGSSSRGSRPRAGADSISEEEGPEGPEGPDGEAGGGGRFAQEEEVEEEATPTLGTAPNSHSHSHSHSQQSIWARNRRSSPEHKDNSRSSPSSSAHHSSADNKNKNYHHATPTPTMLMADYQFPPTSPSSSSPTATAGTGQGQDAETPRLGAGGVVVVPSVTTIPNPTADPEAGQEDTPPDSGQRRRAGVTDTQQRSPHRGASSSPLVPFALTLSDYRPLAADPTTTTSTPNPSSPQNVTPHHRLHPPSPLLPDPISPTSVVPNPMEALAFPIPTAAEEAKTEGMGGGSPRTPKRGSPRAERKSPSPGPRHKQQHERASPSALQVPGFLGAPSSPTAGNNNNGGGGKSPSSDSVRSFRSGTPNGALAPATSDYHPSPNLTANEREREGLSRSSSSDSNSVSTLPPFQPRVTQLAAADLPANRILAKLDAILPPEPTNRSANPTSGLLDQPPRKLLLEAPVLQVVNANTVKDRYLLLFTDMLVIAKPLIEDHALTGEPVPPNLDSHFLVKSVVECKSLKLSADEEPVEEAGVAGAGAGSGGNKKKHPLLVAFVDRFANDPSRAIASLISKGRLTNDGPTIANLLYRNTDLNRNQLGAYLSEPRQRHVLRAYIDRFRFAGVRIDDALRLFLMSVRLPFNFDAADYVIGVLASMWADANVATGIDGGVAHGLMTAIMRLSDALHGGDGPGERFFRDPKPAVPPSVDDFIASFRDIDTRAVVPEDLLARIYTAVRRERVENASDNSIFSMTPDIEATIEPARLPTQLTYRTPSARFTITIPAPDPKFTIKLQGVDLQFDPPVLSFARNATQSFRVTGTALGIRTMVLVKRGANAPRYQGLPLNKAFSIERGFMQHTFQLSFTNHLDTKRKYMFSCRDAETRSRWLRLLRERISVCAGAPTPSTSAQAAANAVAVQVLRDAILAPDEPSVLSTGAPSPRPNLLAPRFGRPVTPSTPRGRLGTPTRPLTSARSNSISRLYPVLYRQEAVSGDKKGKSGPGSAGLLAPSGPGAKVSSTSSSPDLASSELAAARFLHGNFVKSGHELVLTTEQNSLLPLVLTFLNAGLEAAPQPLSLNGTAFQLPPREGTSAPLPSFVSQP